ncbi:MAG: hypothetical protein ACR2H2_12015 [Solirubrobacteraceae bacterium]
MDAQPAGYPWLPHMIDKARAAQAGTLGTYYRYPCRSTPHASAELYRISGRRSGRSVTATRALERIAAQPGGESRERPVGLGEEGR